MPMLMTQRAVSAPFWPYFLDLDGDAAVQVAVT
jgi:hypothetical protein